MLHSAHSSSTKTDSLHCDSLPRARRLQRASHPALVVAPPRLTLLPLLLLLLITRSSRLALDAPGARHTQAQVAKELAKQVYVAEKMSPPSFAQVSYTCASLPLPSLSLSPASSRTRGLTRFPAILSLATSSPLHQTRATLPRSLLPFALPPLASVPPLASLPSLASLPLARLLAVRQFAQNAPNMSYWTNMLKDGAYQKVLLYAVEAYGIFKIGEVGRRSLNAPGLPWGSPRSCSSALTRRTRLLARRWSAGGMSLATSWTRTVTPSCASPRVPSSSLCALQLTHELSLHAGRKRARRCSCWAERAGREGGDAMPKRACGQFSLLWLAWAGLSRESCTREKGSSSAGEEKEMRLRAQRARARRGSSSPQSVRSCALPPARAARSLAHAHSASRSSTRSTTPPRTIVRPLTRSSPSPA